MSHANHDEEHHTLGHYREQTARLFGEKSPATVWIDAKIKRSDGGYNEPVMADDTQMLYLLAKLHTCATRPPGPNDEGTAEDVEHPA